ncbi:hypothetical protein Tco_0317413 [Tanacetum coccineum]
MTVTSTTPRTRSIALKAELRSLKLGDLSIDAYFRKIESIDTILTSLGSPVSNDDAVTIIFEGLPDKYDNVFGIIVHQEPFPDLKMVCSMLTTEEMRLKSRAQASPIDSTFSSPLVLLANGGNNTRRPNVALEKGKPGQATNMGQSGQLAGIETILPNAFNAMALHDPTNGNWNMDTCASSYLNDSVYSLSDDFMTRRSLLHCDITRDLYTVTKPSTIPHTFLTSQYTWHQRLGHPLGKHVRLTFASSSIVVKSCFDIVHLDLWTSLILSLSNFKYYVLFFDHYSQYV